MKRNPVGWFEIYVNEMPRAKAFYEAVFVAKLEELPGSPDLEMWTWPMGEEETPGATGALVKMEGCGGGEGGGTLIYFSCADCAVEQSRVLPAGGKVMKEKFPIGPYGFIALVVDTEGNTIGLHSMV
jgi:uncharacterized protein